MSTPRGRNYTKLAQSFPIPMDEHIVFDEEAHRYTVYGELVPCSATNLVSDTVNDDFSADLIISRNLASWRKKPRHKYFRMVTGVDDATAVDAVKAQWTQANVLGTKLHRRLEALLNDEEEDPDGKTDVEYGVLKAAIDVILAQGWLPRRTELSLWWEAEYGENNGKVVGAGQIDCLFQVDDDLVLVDLKRTEHDLSEMSSPFAKRCKTPLDGFVGTNLIKYSLQLSIYAVMFAQRTGFSIKPTDRWLLQAHPSNPTVRWVQCKDFDAEARFLLNNLEPLHRSASA